jgi:hypothetical protein
MVLVDGRVCCLLAPDLFHPNRWRNRSREDGALVQVSFFVTDFGTA